MKNFIVPVNFSGYSSNAGRFAVQLASRYGAKVTIFHAYHIPVIDPMIPVEYLNELAEKTKRETDEALEKQVNELKEYAQVHHLSTVEIGSYCTLGLAVDEISLAARKLQGDLIVLGRRYTENMAKVLLGSITSSIIGRAKLPVLVVPENVQPETAITDIVYASDLDPADRKNLSKLLSMAQGIKARVHCLHVNTPNDTKNNNAVLVEMREQYDAEAAKGEIVFEKVVANSVAEALLQYINSHQIDMLAMLTHKRVFIMKLFDRSLTKKVAYQVNIPLLIYHDTDN